MTKPPKCVICYKPCWDLQVDEGAENKKLSSDQNQINIEVMFVLENLLKIPESFIQKYLLGRGSACNWISTCDRCSLFIEDALFVNSKINRLQKRLEAFSEKVRYDLKKSCRNLQEDFRNQDDNDENNPSLLITQEIRNFVVQGDSSSEEATSPMDDFMINPSLIPDVYIKEEVDIDAEDEYDDEYTSYEIDPAEAYCDDEPETTKALEPQSSNSDSFSGGQTINTNLLVSSNDSSINVNNSKVIKRKSKQIQRDFELTEANTYKCSWKGCRLTFKHIENVRRHQRTHTGDKPFACEICHRTFSRSDHLSNHLKSKSHKRLTNPQTGRP